MTPETRSLSESSDKKCPSSRVWVMYFLLLSTVHAAAINKNCKRDAQVNVAGPGFGVKVDQAGGVAVKAPFTDVNVNGNAVQVKAPFTNVNVPMSGIAGLMQAIEGMITGKRPA